MRARKCVNKENVSERWGGINHSPFRQKEQKEEEEEGGGGTRGGGRGEDRTGGAKGGGGFKDTVHFLSTSKCAYVFVCVHVCALYTCVRARVSL